MSSTGAIPRRRQNFSSSVKTKKTLHPDTQILVGQDGTEPLNEKYLTISSNGVQTKVPALHASWCISRPLISYSSPPVGNDLQMEGALDVWLEQMDYFKEDLEWMLSLSHHRFWSHIVFEREIHKSLVSYLSQAHRFYEVQALVSDSNFNQVVLPVLNDIHQLVLLVYMRMSTYKESKTCFISPSSFSDLIYRNYIIDMCQILDLCALYVPSNTALLSKMIHNIFSTQPSYTSDVLQVANSVLSVLDHVEETFGVIGHKVTSLRAPTQPMKTMEFTDIVFYLLDTFYTLHNFVKVYPQAATVFQSQEIDVRISNFYEHLVPLLLEQINCTSGDGEEFECFDVEVEQLRATVLAAFRSIVSSTSLDPLVVSPEGEGAFKPPPRVVTESIEKYLHTFSSCLGDKTFIADYHSTYDFKKDVDVLKTHSNDSTSLEYIEDAVQSVLTEMGVQYVITPITNGSSTAAPSSSPLDSTGMSQYAMSGSAEVDEVQLMQMVTAVQDLMPNLGSGFLSECLKHYQYSTEQVINALLEENLPPHLASLDRALVRVQPVATTSHPPTSASSSNKNVTFSTETYTDSYEKGEDEAKLSVMNRANIYNDDEFDVFGSKAKTLDISKVNRGKKKKDLLEQDSDVKERVRVIGRMYEGRSEGRSIYEEESDTEEINEVYMAPANYNDEYDDTYDGNEAGNTDTHSELMMGRRKQRPTIFGKGSLNAPLMGGDGSEDEEGEEDYKATPLASEETEEEFNQRRGLRKGVGGVEFMKELRQSGGVIERKALKYHPNVPDSHYSHNNQRKRANFRFKPVDYHKDHHKPMYFNRQNSKDTSGSSRSGTVEREEEETTDEEGAEGGEVKPAPFCEDPSVVRERMARSRADRDFARNRGGNKGRRYNGPAEVPPQPGFGGTEPQNASVSEPQNGGSSYRGGARPKTFANKGSGKQWRQGGGGEDEGRGYKGGKYKEESSTHGKSQDINFRRKMENKNRQRKQAAQNKFERNN